MKAQLASNMFSEIGSLREKRRVGRVLTDDDEEANSILNRG